MITKKIKQAIDFAIKQHGTQTRKGSNVTYVVHPLDVMNILLKEENLSEDVIIAGICHDLVEDTNTSLIDIKNLFGENVSKLVDMDTEFEELKKDSDEVGTWEARKTDTINRIKNASRYEKMIACADKLANLTDIHNDLKIGFNIFEELNAPKEKQKWYYESMLESFESNESIENSRMFKLLKIKIKDVFD